LYGSPLVTNAAGRQVVDPLAVVAPTLALVAIALALLVAFGPLTDAWQRFAAKRRGFQPSYSARQVARGLGSYAVAVLVIVLAIGGLTVASAYSGSWASLAARSAALTAGADVRVDLTSNALPGAGTTPVTGAPYLAVHGVTAAAPALSTPITMGDNDAGRLLAIPSGDLLSVLSPAGGALDRAALASSLPGSEPTGIRLPAGTTKVRLDATLKATTDGETPAAGINGFAVTALWFENSAGSVMTVTFPAVDAGVPVTESSFEASLPASATPWRLAAIDYSVKADSGWLETSYRNLVATTTGGEQPVAFDTSTWGSTTLPNNFGGSGRTGVDGVTIGLGAGGPGAPQAMARYTDVDADPRTGVFQSFEPPPPLPFVVSAELARHYGIGIDDPFEVRFTGTGLVIPGTIAGIVPLIPGIQSPNAVVVDLTALNTYILRTSQFVPAANQVWLGASGPVDLGSALPKGAEVVTARTAGGDQSFSAPAELALWIAAAGCLLLAAISLGAVALTIGRSRRGEVIVLRAVGVSAREQSSARLKELLSVIGIAVLFGILNGLAVSWLTITNLARSAVLGVPLGLQPTLQFALLTGLVLLAAGLVALLTIALSYAARVHRQALDTDERLETR
ncbi:MAG TPA: FtsX-like permease family protein, partial [Terrimesophilobacter sp.]|uniref:FtsX-like permease family protein n=1 Tax=Terrimesophilobacter sp. TaxID=2906435 RepID=UPI002F93FE6F